MPKPKPIEPLEALARDLIGDDKTPDLFFVTDQGVCVTVSRDFHVAHAHWRALARRSPLVESALENRSTGTLCSVEPESDEPGARLRVVDDGRFLRRRS